MKIFSNFDTKLRKKLYEENAIQYGSQNVFIFGRSSLYRYLKVFTPLLLLLIVNISLFVIYYSRFQGIFYYILVPVIILDVIVISYVAGKYIDYLLDFMVVLPHAMVLYEQKGIFDRYVITINQNSVKTISVEKKGFLYSVFNNGDITILSEGLLQDDKKGRNYGEIVLKRVSKPEYKREKIIRMLGVAKNE